MFLNLKFSIIEFGINLTSKRLKILKDLVAKNEGSYIEKQEISRENTPDIIIASKSIKYENLSSLFQKNSIEDVDGFIRLISDRFVTPEFVTFSVKEKKKLPAEDYLIRITEDFAVKRNRASENFRIDDFYSKKKKSINENKGNLQSNISEQVLLIKEDFVSSQIKVRDYTDEYRLYNTSSTYYTNGTRYTGTNSIKDLKMRAENQRIKNILSLTESDELGETHFKDEEESNLKSLCDFGVINNIKINTTPNTLQSIEINKTNNNNKLLAEIQNRLLFNLKSSNDYSSNEYDDEACKTVLDSNFQLEDAISTTDSSLYSTTFSSQFTTNSKSLKITSTRKKPDKTKFAFNTTSNSAREYNLNEHITSELEKILDYHSNENNVFESLAYRKAISQLKNVKETIKSCDQLKNYNFFGKSIGNKIKEILLTGKLKKTEYLKDDDKNQTIKLFTSIWGIGMSQANKLYKKGIRTIEDIRKQQHLLNNNQRIGLKYFEDLNQRIPRKEIHEIYLIIKQELNKIIPEEILVIELCGSYRRGKETCGDIDVLITRKDHGEIDGILQSLVESLTQKKIITETLQLGGFLNRFQFMGICKLKDNPNRRIDLKIYKKIHFPFALLYFTGSAYFNRSMRLFASKLGYSLSDLSLKPVEGINEDLKFETEEDIFKILDLDYIPPEKRDI